jgi:hypothetical protein
MDKPTGPKPWKIPVDSTGLPPDTVTVKIRMADSAAAILRHVETFRKKSFLRPVHVRVLERTEFASMDDHFASDYPDTVKALINKILVCEGFMRPGDDYFAQFSAMVATGVAGFYIPGTDSLYLVIPDSAVALDLSDSATIFH